MKLCISTVVGVFVFLIGGIIGFQAGRAYEKNLHSVTKKVIERKIDDKKQELLRRAPVSDLLPPLREPTYEDRCG